MDLSVFTVTSLHCAQHVQELKAWNKLNQDWKELREEIGEISGTLSQVLLVREKFKPDMQSGKILLLSGTWGTGLEGECVYLQSLQCQEICATHVSTVHGPLHDFPLLFGVWLVLQVG